MFSLEESHRILSVIEKARKKGHYLQFLTGDAICNSDNYFFDLYHGIRNLADSLKLYYFKKECAFDYMIYLDGSGSKISVFERKDDEELGCVRMEVADLKNKLVPPKHGGERVRNRPRRESEIAGDDKEKEKVAEETQDVADSVENSLKRIKEVIKQCQDKKFILLLEGMEWIAKLYANESDTTWIATLQSPDIQKAKNLLSIVTIKDMELLKKYSFVEEATYIGDPSADEIFVAYWRHLMKSPLILDSYKYSIKDLDDIAHSMGAGKKSLVQCMRILRQVLAENATELRKDEFANCAEQNIEEIVKWDDVILNSETKDSIETAVNKFLSDSEGKKARKGIILTGPPGTGKTMIAKALATEKHCFFMAPTLADLKGEYVGQTSGKVKRIFDEARAHEPTILFIDEADTVFPSRAGGSSDRDSFGLDMVNEFLQQIDGAKTGKQKIFVVAATNRVETIDPAIRSRLSSNPIEIPLPDRISRLKMLEKKLLPFKLEGKNFCDEVLDRTERMSGRDIDNLVKVVNEICESKGLFEPNKVVFDDAFKVREKSVVKDNLGLFSNIITPEDNILRLDHIVGYEGLKNTIDIQVHYIKVLNQRKELSKLKSFAIRSPKGVLLYGPPGNGKSELAKTIAGANGFYFFKVLSQDFAGISSEQKLKKLRDIFSSVEVFSHITTAPGVVLFFDEFDSLAGTDVLDPVVRGTLLDYIADKDGIRSENSRVLFIAATNFYEKIDEAIKRSGRIDEHLFMDNPSKEDGPKMLELFLENCKVENSDFYKNAYDRILERVQSNPNKIIHKQIEFWTNHQMLMLGADDKERKDLKAKLANVLVEIRPSGSDLENWACKFKEYAFRNNSYEDGKLLIKNEFIDNLVGVNNGEES